MNETNMHDHSSTSCGSTENIANRVHCYLSEARFSLHEIDVIDMLASLLIQAGKLAFSYN